MEAMKDSDIMLALLCCSTQSKMSCSQCPYFHKSKCFELVRRDAIDAIKRLTAERDLARKIARMLPDVCMGDCCSGDESVGIPACKAYQAPDVLGDGTLVLEGCMGILVGGCAKSADEG